MTEVVTSTAAFSQLSLQAPKPQVFGIESQAGSAEAISPASFGILQDVSAQGADDQSSVNQHQGKDGSSAEPRPDNNGSGPSRARVEIKHLDIGLTPSEVVGTPDVLQRFDDNGDGRVDLIESARAGLARQKVFTFAGLAAASSRSPILGQVEDAPQPAPVAASGAPITADGVPAPAASQQTPFEKSFAPAQADAPVPGTKKFADAAEAVAAQGSTTEGVDVPRKFYGQGVEVVAGQFAAAAEAAPKYHDKVVVKDLAVVTEDGTGEAKYYDRVAQAETDNASEDAGQGAEGNYYEKAQQLANGKKGAVPEVAVYAEAAAIVAGEQAEAAATVVTA
jgi:hypothetical protein